MMEWFIRDAEGLFKAQVELGRDHKTLTFGSRKDWNRYHAGLISLKDFQKIKNSQPLLFTGAKNEKGGNRKIKLSGRDIIFKERFGRHHTLKLSTTNSRFKMLEKLQTVFTPITYRLNNEYIWITFDESVLKEQDHKFIENRIGSLDLNPNYVAFVVQDFSGEDSEIIHRSIFDLVDLNKQKNNDKKKFEVLEISKKISKLAKHYKCEMVGLEKLDMKSKDHKKGKRLNKLINNDWKRVLIVQNLTKHLNIAGIKNQEIIAAYSSTVGCLDNPSETDSVAAALEIGRRTFMFSQRFLKKNPKFSDVDIMFPKIDRGLIKERWNSILSDYNPKNIGYKGIHEYLKKEKKLNELRFLFKDYDFSSWSCFRSGSRKSMVFHNFL